MDKVIVNLLPLVMGAALGGPAWIVMSLILLRSRGGVSKAAAFATGALTVRILQFVLFGYVFGVAIDTGGEEAFRFVPPTLALVAGLILLITAAKTWWRQEEDSDSPRPGWMVALSGVSARSAFGMAVLMMLVAVKQWVFTLSAIATIDEAHLGITRTVLAYLFFILAAQSLVLAPIIGSAIAPAQWARKVEVMLAWLERNSRVVTIVISLIFGAWFVTKGISTFLGYANATAASKTAHADPYEAVSRQAIAE